MLRPTTSNSAWREARHCAVIVGLLGAAGCTPTAFAQGHPALDASSSDGHPPHLRVVLRDAGDVAIDGAIEQPPAVASADHALRNLMGRRMEEIEADAGAPLDGGSAWRPFRSDVFVQFRGDRVVRITARVPAGTACNEAARRFGFDRAMPALRRAHTCEWPPSSERHLIEPGLAARFDLPTGSFEVWLVE